jgi:hypothetical protein
MAPVSETANAASESSADRRKTRDPVCSQPGDKHYRDRTGLIMTPKEIGKNLSILTETPS